MACRPLKFIALDLLSKWFAITNLQMYQQVPIIDGLFSFTAGPTNRRGIQLPGQLPAAAAAGSLIAIAAVSAACCVSGSRGCRGQRSWSRLALALILYGCALGKSGN